VRRVRDLGEFGLIERIARLAGRARGADVVLGIGDDAAVLRARAREDVVASTDAALAGVHFRLDEETPAVAGARAAVGCLSDLAAMGARPLGLLLALALPPSTPVATALALVRGVVAAARRAGAPLVGGNVTRAREIGLTLTALGAVERGRALRRDRGRPGDRVFVTGTLGRSALERARGRVRSTGTPRLSAGRRLLRVPGVGACIDVSDGLAADLLQLARASGVAGRLVPEQVPLPPGFAAACARLGRHPLALALAGEDYELLFSVRPSGPGARALTERLGVRVTEIGRLEAGRPALRGLPRGHRGWRHF
jgi:thiamine-monophosphate kinase